VNAVTVSGLVPSIDTAFDSSSSAELA